MSTVNTGLRREAESIFTDLGYAVTPEGNEMRAERKWRVVRVTPMEDPDHVVERAETASTRDEYRCFVTYASHAETLERRLKQANPAYEWAVIGIDGDDYVVW